MTSNGLRDYVDHYDRFYREHGSLRRWRDAGAQSKGRNVVDLWSSVGGNMTPNVVELGCGDGAIAEWLQRHAFFHHYTGYDIAPSAIQIARQRLVPNSRFEIWQEGTVSTRRFDLAIISHVLEHVEDPRGVLRDAMALSRHVFIEVPLEYTRRTPENFQWNDTGHINLYSPKLIRHLAQSVGLIIVEQRVACPGFRSFTYRMGWPRGATSWLIKMALLRSNRRLATKLLTYHACLMGVVPEDDYRS